MLLLLLVVRRAESRRLGVVYVAEKCHAITIIPASAYMLPACLIFLPGLCIERHFYNLIQDRHFLLTFLNVVSANVFCIKAILSLPCLCMHPLFHTNQTSFL